jgi:hypothetical protein
VDEPRLHTYFDRTDTAKLPIEAYRAAEIVADDDVRPPLRSATHSKFRLESGGPSVLVPLVQKLYQRLG